MKSMKRLAALLCAAAFALPGGALAQEYVSITEIREQAKEGWHETYTDKYGREIAVDVDVQVFGEAAAPVLKMKPVNYKLNPALLSEDTVWDDTDGVGFYKNNPADYVFMTKSGEQPLTVYHSYSEKIDMNKRYMEEFGTTLTVQEMVDHLCSILEQQGIPTEDYLFDQPMDFSVRCKVKKKTLEVVEPAIYLAHFWPTMYGLPALAPAGNVFYNPAWPGFQPQLVLGMRGKDEYQIAIYALEETEMLAQDVPLCSVQEVIDCVEKSIEDGHIRRVFDVMFGYAVYNDPNMPKDLSSIFDARARYYLVPSWVVHCIYMKNPKEEFAYGEKHDDDLNLDEKNVLGYKTLIINAQNAEMLDPYDKSKEGHGDADYKGFIPWDDVK